MLVAATIQRSDCQSRSGPPRSIVKCKSTPPTVNVHPCKLYTMPVRVTPLHRVTGVRCRHRVSTASTTIIRTRTGAHCSPRSCEAQNEKTSQSPGTFSSFGRESRRVATFRSDLRRGYSRSTVRYRRQVYLRNSPRRESAKRSAATVLSSRKLNHAFLFSHERILNGAIVGFSHF